jgi:hypothetical protein
MARTRIISQSKALFVSPTGLLAKDTYGYSSNTGLGGKISGLAPQQLHRIDTFSFDIDLAGGRQDIREFGQLARIGTIRVGELTPTVSVGYYLGDGANEHNLGFNVQGINGAGTTSQFISGILTESTLKKEKNLYLLTTQEGTDAFSASSYTVANRSGHDVVGFGNATLNSYSINLSVGEIPRADVEFECGNIKFYTGTSSGNSLTNPALNRQNATTIDSGVFVITGANTGETSVDVLRPGDVTVSFSNNSVGVGGAGLSGIQLQSAAIEVPLSRETIERLGSILPFAKPLEFPINVTCTLNGLVTDFTEGSLQSLLTGCGAESNTDITITVKDRCGLGQDKLKYVFKNAVLDSQNFSLGLDDNEAVDLTFSAQIAGANTADAGVFMSGAFASNIGVQGRDNEKPNFYLIG